MNVEVPLVLVNVFSLSLETLVAAVSSLLFVSPLELYAVFDSKAVSEITLLLDGSIGEDDSVLAILDIGRISPSLH